MAAAILYQAHPAPNPQPASNRARRRLPSFIDAGVANLGDGTKASATAFPRTRMVDLAIGGERFSTTLNLTPTAARMLARMLEVGADLAEGVQQ